MSSKVEMKKNSLRAPGKAVIVSGTSKKPPIGSSSNVKDYVMGYTDIFESSPETAVVDIEEGDAVSDCSDNEITAHSMEGAQYEGDDAGGSDGGSGDDGSGDGSSREDPPPLSREESDGEEDSDAREGPPPLDSDDAGHSDEEEEDGHLFCESPENHSDLEAETSTTARAARHESDADSDASEGIRESPPPLDSDGDGDVVDVSAGEDGVLERSEEFDEQRTYQEEREEPEERAPNQESTRDVHTTSMTSSEDEAGVGSEKLDDGLKDEEQENEERTEEEEEEEEEKNEREEEQKREEVELKKEEEEAQKESEDEKREEEEREEEEEEEEEKKKKKEKKEKEKKEKEKEERDTEQQNEEKEKAKKVEEDENKDEIKDEIRQEMNEEEEHKEGQKRENIKEEEDDEEKQDVEEEYDVAFIDDALEWDESFVPKILPEPVIEERKIPAIKAATFAEKPKISKPKAKPDQVAKRFDTKAEVHPGKAVKKYEKRQPEKKPVELDTKTASKASASKSRTSKSPKTTPVNVGHAKTANVVQPKVQEQRTPQQKEKKKRLSNDSTVQKEKLNKAASGVSTKKKEEKKVKEERGSRELKPPDKRASKTTGEAVTKAAKSKKTSSSESLSKRKEAVEATGPKQSWAKGTSVAHNGSMKKDTSKKPSVTKSVAVGTDSDPVSRRGTDNATFTQTETQTRREVGNLSSEKYRGVTAHDEAPVPSRGHYHHHHHTPFHDRSKHVWLCRDDEIHKLIAQKASLLKEYESGSLAGRRLFSDINKKDQRRGDHRGENHKKDTRGDCTGMTPDVEFALGGRTTKTRSARPISEIFPPRAPYSAAAARKKNQRLSLQYPFSGSSSDDDEKTDRAAALKKERGTGTFAVGLSARNVTRDSEEDSDHEETCEYCAAEKAAREEQEKSAAWEGPHHPRNLLLGVVYAAKYLGSSQIMSPQSPNKTVRMEQAQEAVGRIKVPEGEEQPTTDVDLFISTERIKVVNSSTKEVMLDHALRTVSFIADIGDILVLMVRQTPGDMQDVNASPKPSQILASLGSGQTDRKVINITCHVFQCTEAQVIAKSIGQAFNVAYQEFLRVNGMTEDTIEDAEYNGVLEAQKILGEDLSLLADETKAKEVVVNKKPGETLGIMILESGWGSMIPTAIVAHLAKDGPTTKSGRLNVGDQILEVNGTSLVGLTLTECQTHIKSTRPQTKVVFKIVSCPPTVQVVVNRPDTKYQLGFSVQNGMICSLMRGSIAERGGVRVGHRIIEINNESVVATSHQHIVDLLATTVGEITMKTMPASMYRLLVGLDQPQYI